ncbi:hypothetical protein ACLMJK_001354 [Lecanora helva]
MAEKPPLTGLRVVELAGLAPAPFASLLLADYGAHVLRIDRPHTQGLDAKSAPPTGDTLTRHKASIALNLKNPQGLALLKRLLDQSDVFIDPFRPGVLESLGLAPAELLISNPRLIIARLTGFRRDGPFAAMAGHDINYLAVSGILSQLGPKHRPPYPPANLLADFAGGGLMCAFGILAALLGRVQTGKGQIVEANMVDGSAYLGTFLRYFRKTPMGNQPRGENLLDGGCPWYQVYECADGGYMAVGALEPQFFSELVKGLELNVSQTFDRTEWSSIEKRFRNRFLQKPRKEWEKVFLGKDACCTPVLTQAELEEQKYDQRPAVHLSGSPGLPIPDGNAWNSTGLAPGSGGDDLLWDWIRWKRGRDYDLQEGGLVQIMPAKL